MRKVSSNRILSSFNEFVQVYYLFFTELTNDQFLHVTGMHYGYSKTKLIIKREVDNAAKAFD